MTENEAIARFKSCQENVGKCEKCRFYSCCSIYDMEDTAIKALEEVRQYREIGTVEELIRGKRYMDIAKHHGTIGRVIDECVAYEAIGTPEECRAAVEKQTETLTVEKAKTIAAKAICIGCGYLADCKCDYNGGNCMVSKPMLESVLKSFDDWNRRADNGKTD